MLHLCLFLYMMQSHTWLNLSTKNSISSHALEYISSCCSDPKQVPKSTHQEPLDQRVISEEEEKQFHFLEQYGAVANEPQKQNIQKSLSNCVPAQRSAQCSYKGTQTTLTGTIKATKLELVYHLFTDSPHMTAGL